MDLIYEACSDQKSMLNSVRQIATGIASQAPLAVYDCKRIINDASDHNTADSLD